MDTPRPSPRTNRTRRAPHPVLIGHAAPLTPYAAPCRRRRWSSSSASSVLRARAAGGGTTPRRRGPGRLRPKRKRERAPRVPRASGTRAAARVCRPAWPTGWRSSRALRIRSKRWQRGVARWFHMRWRNAVRTSSAGGGGSARGGRGAPGSSGGPATCPVSTGGGTRRVQLVRGEIQYVVDSRTMLDRCG